MNRPEILDTAKKCVCGQREQDYGSPENNFQIIAKLWTAYYGHEFNPLDVAMMMSLLKIARIRTGTATEDSFVDAAGYIACGGEIATGEKSYKRHGGAVELPCIKTNDTGVYIPEPIVMT